jgi:hypothetical protein
MIKNKMVRTVPEIPAQFVDALKLKVSDPCLVEITKNDIKNSCTDSFEHRFNINENL